MLNRAERLGCFLTSIALALSWLTPPSLLYVKNANADLAQSLGLSPYWDWRTMETAHFRITFPAELAETAQKEANYLEEAHAILAPKLYWQPTQKTQTILIDNADLANGLTSPVFRLGMVLWATPPDPWFSTAYYDNWLRMLAFHEYTHFLNMDNTQELYVPLRYLLGDVLLPNSAWPTWMLEGLAVYMETRYTQGGRGRSPYYDMIVRAAVDEGVLDTAKFLTLDKINGDVPYNPAGETYYLFGYQLINQLARTPVPGTRTADGIGELHGGEDALGVLSLRSASRVPYFINGNVENIIGKDWYSLWEQWVTEARATAHQQLARIRRYPVTTPELMTPSDGIETLGPSLSSDRLWLAYSSSTADRRSGLFLQNLKSGQRRRLDDKLSGATVSFTPDAKTLIYSAVERTRIYYQLSDLRAYDLDRDRTYPITHGLRARDPDVSPDGRLVTFTLTQHETTGLAIAPLERDAASGELRLGTVRKIESASAKYDRVSAPRFAKDGKRIFYSIHRQGQLAEDLMAWDLITDAPTTLVADGRFNRYATPAADGSVYFISDASGVDNLYRLPPTTLDNLRDSGFKPKPQLATNVTTALTTPSIGPDGAIYAAIYATKGWGVARLRLLEGTKIGAPAEKPADNAPTAEDVRIALSPAPRADEQSIDHSAKTTHEIRDYAIFPSIWPRQWLILPAIYPGGLYLQADVGGFDALDRHEYRFSGGYNSQIPKFDWLATYVNRTLGPALALLAADHTSRFNFNNQGVTDYSRKEEYRLAATYPIPWTYSTLVPEITAGGERIYRHYRGYDPDNDDLVGRSPFVTSVDASFSFSNVETSRLAISSERGITLNGGFRIYSDPAFVEPTFKAVLKHAQYYPILEHAVLSPALRGMWSSAFDPNYGDANAIVQGRTAGLIPSTFGALFDPLGLRGYPQGVFYSRSAIVASLDFRFPILRIFRGWGTQPVFLDNLYGFGFADAGWFPQAKGVPALPSLGGGLTLTTEVFLRVPLSVTLELDQGVASAYGGKPDFSLQLGLGSLQF